MADDPLGDFPPLEGEVLPKEEPRTAVVDYDASIIGGLTRAEIDVQIATAHRYPRSLQKVQRMVQTLATLDVETATSCFYRKPQRVQVRDPKTGRERWEDGFVEGASIRFAEIVMQAWGNGRVASRVTDQTDTEIEATGIFHDLESNVAWAKSVRVSIVGRNGNKYPAHLITTTGNAAAAKAIRNAILAGIPRGIWNQGYQEALAAAKGDAKTLPERRKVLFAKAAEEGVTKGQVFAILGVKGEADITIDHLFDAAGYLNAIRDNEATVEELIAARRAPTDERGLDEAFGKATSPPPPPTPAAAKPAPPAEENKPTSASATAASPPSPAVKDSGQKASAEPPPAGNVVELRKGPESPKEDEPKEDVGLDENVTRAFNGFAAYVAGAETWEDLRNATAAFLGTEAFAAGDAALQRQAKALAHQRAQDAGWAADEALADDLLLLRLWLATVEPGADPSAVRKRWRPAMRGAEYRDAPSEVKDAVVREVNAASGEQ